MVVGKGETHCRSITATYVVQECILANDVLAK